MKIDRYALKSESGLTVFEFISEGPQGTIRKMIHFQETNEPGLYNLAFGDKNSDTDEMDDLSVSNNGDSEKVLATVVAALYAFFDKHPDAFVYATLYTPLSFANSIPSLWFSRIRLRSISATVPRIDIIILEIAFSFPLSSMVLKPC